MNDVLDALRELRTTHPDVDHNWWPTISDNKPFEIMVGCILTQNTNWNNVEQAIKNLNEDDLLTPTAILNTDVKAHIRPSGYYNQKADRLERLARFIQHNDIQELQHAKTEQLREELLNIKGIGAETADSILLYALNHTIFIIDEYTRRFVEHFNLYDRDASYHELQSFFQAHIEPEVQRYKTIHALIVEFGKTSLK
jgi:endonuclease-3 related protein